MRYTVDLYLASSSPRRSDLLLEASIPFKKIPNKLLHEPTLTYQGSLDRLGADLMALATLKAEGSASVYKGIILGVDTTVLFGNAILGKPTSVSNAVQGLLKMSGNKQHVLTGYCLFDTISQVKITNYDVTTVWFKDISKQEIEDYCRRSNPLDKAGGYDIREIKDTFIRDIDGSFSNVVGLPIEMLTNDLRQYQQD